MYLADRINKRLACSGLQTMIGREVTTTQVKRTLNKAFKSFGIKFHLIRTQSIADTKGPGEVPVSGDFDPKNNAICIYLHISSARKNFVFSQKDMDRLIFLLSQTAQHESVHKNQCAKREPYPRPNVRVYYSSRMSQKRVECIDYLSDMDEVEAYAHDIAMEMVYFYPHRKQTELFNNIDSLRNLESFNYYKRVFKGTDWTKLRSILLKKTAEWLPYVTKPPKGA